MALAGAALAQSDVARISSLADAGNSRQALREIESFLRRNPSDEEGRLLRGVLLAETGEAEAAKAMFEGLLADYPTSPAALNNLAVLYAAENQPDRAIEILEEALAGHSSYGTVFLNLRRVYGSLAGDAYRQALSPGSAGVSKGPELDLVRDWTGGMRREPDGSTRQETLAAVAKPELGDPVAGDPEAIDAAALSEAARPVATAQVRLTAAEQVEERIHAWAQAWSAQDVTSYLSFYSRRFVPGDGVTRQAWERRRRERLKTPSFVRVEVNDLEIRDEDGRLEAWFTQRYESDSFHDVVTKYLSFVREDGAWVIGVEGSVGE